MGLFLDNNRRHQPALLLLLALLSLFNGPVHAYEVTIEGGCKNELYTILSTLGVKSVSVDGVDETQMLTPDILTLNNNVRMLRSSSAENIDVQELARKLRRGCPGGSYAACMDNPQFNHFYCWVRCLSRRNRRDLVEGGLDFGSPTLKSTDISISEEDKNSMLYSVKQTTPCDAESNVRFTN